MEVTADIVSVWFGKVKSCCNSLSTSTGLTSRCKVRVGTRDRDLNKNEVKYRRSSTYDVDLFLRRDVTRISVQVGTT